MLQASYPRFSRVRAAHLSSASDGTVAEGPHNALDKRTLQALHEDMPSDTAPFLFQVFLSHNHHDKPAVRYLKQRLADVGITAWLDEDELRPGVPWQQLLEVGINTSSSVAVLIGNDGIGPWENEEMQAALRLAVREKRPVIPVLLPGAPAVPELPMFLGNRTWVDMRTGVTAEGLSRLVWGITGKKPHV